MFCSQCGAELSPGHAQCPQCQTEIAPQAGLTQVAPTAPKFLKLFITRIVAPTLIFILIIFGALMAITWPVHQKARSTQRSRACQENLQRIDRAKEQWALDNGKEDGAAVTWDDLVGSYLAKMPKCPAGGDYQLNPIGNDPTCTCQVKDWEVPHSLEEY